MTGDREVGGPHVIVTDIGEYVDKQCCQRNFKLRLNQSEIARRFPFYGTVRQPLNPILATFGHEKEEEVKGTLAARMRCLNPVHEGRELDLSWADLLAALEGLAEGEECFAREVEIARTIGAFNVSGRMDFVILTWRGGRPVLRIVECKASRRDKTYHRVQLAAYRLMVGEALSGGVIIAGRRRSDVVIEAAVARIDPESRRLQDALALPSLELREEVDDLRHLLAPGGPLDAIRAADLDALSYRLEPKCDSCIHCPICMPESERQGRLELLGLDPSVVRALRAAGIADLDALADLDLSSSKAAQVRRSPAFGADLDDLVRRAKARRSTLPSRQEGDHQVMGLAHHGVSLLPAHANEAGFRTVRVYLDVEYDYVEDRLVALCAHVTDSDRLLVTTVEDGDPIPVPLECPPDDPGAGGPLRGAYVVRMIERAWAREDGADSEAEGAMLRSFFDGLGRAIAATAGKDEFRPVHFYVWSPRDIEHLIEACSRAGGPLLRSLTELLGCREKCRGDLEQLIFTSMAEEIARTKALGHTSLSLTVAAGARWYGFPSFHWVREVDGEAVDLAYAFRRDLFDFRTYLYLTPEGEWAPRGRNTPGAQRRYMEVRTRFSADINAPYWYAMWDALPEDEEWKDPLLKRALQDYRRGGAPAAIRAMLMAKCEALRWLEERFQHKGRGIEKPMVPVADFAEMERHFTDRYDLVRACQDFMRLDHHMQRSAWLADLARSPAARVAEGACIPLRDVRFVKEGGRDRVTATVDLERFGMNPSTFLSLCGLEGGMMRLSPYRGALDEGPSVGQALYGGATVMVTALDVVAGTFQAEVVPFFDRGRGSEYVLPSSAPREGVMPFALAGEPQSAYVKDKVDRWLEENSRAPAIAWFDPVRPAVPVRRPPDEAQLAAYRRTLRALRLHTRALDDVQVEACLEGLSSTVQLLHGPPGTGKTNTAAAAVLLRLAARPGHLLFLLAATTHTAVDELCQRLRDAVPPFRMAADTEGVANNPVRVLKLHNDGAVGGDDISCEDLAAVRTALEDGDVVVCGTVNENLKLARNLDRYGWPKGRRADGLVVDEASMMLFPDFLALATLVAEDGEIMLAGDHLQLSPITAHDWERETREQVVRLAPHQSAYNAMRRLAAACQEGAVRSSALTTTYRLTPELTDLIAAVYRREGVKLASSKPPGRRTAALTSLRDMWAEPGVYLVVHREAASRKSNAFEAGLVRDILMARGVSEAEVPPRTVSVITPHRAQRGLLKELLSDLSYHIKLIDTVERLQGGECETVIVSGTQSDPAAISGNAEFILDLNRTNVIFSRAKERLIVVCSSNLLDSVPADPDDYASSWLWKHLRAVCDRTAVRLEDYEHAVEVRVPSRYGIGAGQ